MSLSQHHRHQPRCDSEPDEDQQRSTLVTGESPPGSFKKPSATPVSASSDSGYSSRTGASSSSKASAGKTPKPPRLDSAPAGAKSRSSSSDAKKKSSGQISAKTSRQNSRSRSKAPSPLCNNPSCLDPKCHANTSNKPKPPLAIETPVYSYAPAIPTLPVPSPLAMAPPYSTYYPPPSGSQPPHTPTYHTPAPPQPSQAPSRPPVPIPRRPRTQSSSRSRPASFAEGTQGTWVYQSQHSNLPPPQSHVSHRRPPSFHANGMSQSVGHSPGYAAGPAQSGGAWVRSDTSHANVSRPPPPTSRPAISHRPTEPLQGDRASVYGTAQVHQYSQASAPDFGRSAHSYDSSSREMRPPPLPSSSQYPPRIDSAHPSDEFYGRRGSVDFGYDDEYLYDPYGTIQQQRVASRNRIAPYQHSTGRSTAYYRNADSRYPDNTLILERTSSRPPAFSRVPSRMEKTDRYTQQARAYQDEIETRAINSNDLVERMGQLQIEPPSPHHRRPSQSQSRHGRSRSRAASSISRTGTEASLMRLTMDGNAIQIEGDTEGRNIQFKAGEDGQPLVTIGGPSSPTKSRERKYIGSGSQRSGASYAERTGGKTGSGGSPIDGQTVASSRSNRRRSVISP